MATIKGLTIEIGGETTGLSKALNDVNKTSRNLSKELGQIGRQLKFDPKNTTLLAQKQKVLGDQIATTRDKLVKLKDAEKQVQEQFKRGEVSEEQYRALQREIVATESKLKHYESQLKEVSDSHVALSNKLQDASKKMKDMGGKIKGVGDSLTKKITLPAAGVATAVGGMVASFGWKRLTGLDSAKAQLQGLGYEVEDVDRISKQVNESIQGTTTTMAEGVSVAAGALAAGVKEGAELERYIKLVGDAAVGANRPVGDMATIFNRVQGAGKLMTQELNMIEDGMPGFSQAMADGLGVTQEEFRKMVTAGEVSSDDFLNVMEDFAGDMSDAYAGSWEGMVANTKSNIGIIGESILGGVFEQSKESIAEFLEYLRSDDVREWAAETGAKVGEAFEKVIDVVKRVLEWWTGLDDGTQSLIGKAALLVVGIGPVLSIFGNVVEKVGGVIDVSSKVVKNWDKIKSVGSRLSAGLKSTVGFIFSPAGAIMLGIIAIIAIGVLLYKNWDTIKEKAGQLKDFVTAKFDELKQKVSDAWNNIRDSISKSINSAKEKVASIVEGIRDKVSSTFDSVKSKVTNIWNNIKTAISNPINAAKNTVSSVVGGIRDKISSTFNSVKSKVSSTWSGIKTAIANPINAARDAVKSAIDRIKGFFSGLKLKFPKIQMPKLPKFTLTGKFSLMPPSVPKIGIKWNAEGGIFRKPTVIPTMAGLQGFAEPRTGGEAIIPLNKLPSLMAQAMEKAGGAGLNLNIYPQHLTPEELDRTFRYLNRRFGVNL